jgi:hypothetical protein
MTPTMRLGGSFHNFVSRITLVSLEVCFAFAVAKLRVGQRMSFESSSS